MSLLRAFGLAGCVVLTACSSSGSVSKPLIADDTLHLTSKIGVSVNNLVAGSLLGLAIQLVYDPLAPNWEIQETKLADDVYRYDLRMKRFNTGGAGEALQAMRRRAAQLQREGGYVEYRVLEFSEGIESQTLGAKRVAEGVVRLVKRGGEGGKTGV